MSVVVWVFFCHMGVRGMRVSGLRISVFNPFFLQTQAIQKVFSQYGKVESVRLRSIAFDNPKLPRKAALIAKNFHKDRDSVNAYVVSSCH